MRYQGRTTPPHDETARAGVLLINLGTPEAPTPAALRRYLAEFLWDPRVIELPRPLWWLLLHVVILRLRPRRSAAAYRRVWTEHGAPLLVHSRDLASALQQALDPGRDRVRVELGMRYGRPSVAGALERLAQRNVQRLLVLPLYPQYSATTTASALDAVFDDLKTRRWLPELRYVNAYHDFEPWIATLSEHVRSYRNPEARLLFSFHGIPRRYFDAGDPYFCHCHKTARLVAEHLQLAEDDWQVTFQSRFGREEWLRPYTDEVLEALPARGVRHVDVVCPGFATDCLETLEEIAMENRDRFLASGGETFNYIPCLNARPGHVAALAALIRHHTQGWTGFGTDNAMRHTEQHHRRVERVRKTLDG